MRRFRYSGAAAGLACAALAPPASGADAAARPSPSAAGVAARSGSEAELPPARSGVLDGLVLQIDAAQFGVDQLAVRQALVRELGGVPNRAERVLVQLRVVPGGMLQVSYRGPSGRSFSRSVRTPERADQVPELTALLVGNMARDQTSELLAQIQTAPRDESSAASSIRETQPALPLESVNLSLFAPLALRDAAEQRRFACEFGLAYSHLGALSGFGLTFAGLLRVDGTADGVEIGGLAYADGSAGAGVRIGTLLGWSQGDFDGLALSAGVLYAGGATRGAQIASVASVSLGALAGAELAVGYAQSGAVVGLQASLGASYARGAVSGAQLGAGASLAAGPVSGVQAAGAFDWSSGAVSGAQIAGMLNVAPSLDGLQLGVVNVGGAVRGAQIGIVNVASSVQGLQLGLVNVADEVQGQSFGVVPYSRKGRTQIVTWYNSSQPLNIGVRFHSGALYVMPTLAYEPGPELPWTEAAKGHYATGVSLGGTVPLGGAFVDLDANFSQRSQGWQPDVSEIDLRYRLLAGWQWTPAFATFVGGGLRHHFRVPGYSEVSLTPELSVGLQLL